MLSDFGNLIPFCKSEVTDRANAEQIGRPGGEARESAVLHSLTLGGWPGCALSARAVHAPAPPAHATPGRWWPVPHQHAPGKAGRWRWQHAQVWKKREVQPLCGARGPCDRGRRAEGREAAPGGHSPASSAMCLPDSQYLRWFGTAVDTKLHFRVVIALEGAGAGGLTTSRRKNGDPSSRSGTPSMREGERPIATIAPRTRDSTTPNGACSNPAGSGRNVTSSHSLRLLPRSSREGGPR
jgi:hypothetical protein